MWTGIFSIGSSIVTGISDYFKGKQEISKVQLEADKKIILAEAEAKAKRLDRESEQDYDLDKIAMQNMEKTWKDELILVIFMVPLVMSFIPSYQEYVTAGFASLALVPDWYMYILVGMITVIYGMRGMLKMLLQMAGSRFGFKSNKKDSV
jgi:hypothetical protein